MDVVSPGDCTPPDAGSAVTIGAFDGVHLGHRAVIAELRRLAAGRGLASTVVTFDRHPAAVVRPDSAPAVLTDLAQKLDLLADTGIERTLVVPFDIDRANETAEDFVTDVLVGRLGARLVVVGEDFHFGHGRKGNVALLAERGAVQGFDVVGYGLQGDAGQAVSSTRIRHLVATGDVAGAAALLGRPHQLRGTVVRGDGRGGTALGFPTANVAVAPDLAVPALGIYAGRYTDASGAAHGAAISVGRRPTFYDGGTDTLVEAYLLDFDGDLYDQPARVDFVAHLRPERRFDAVDDLIAQMHRDVAGTRAVLAAAGVALGAAGDPPGRPASLS